MANPASKEQEEGLLLFELPNEELRRAIFQKITRVKEGVSRLKHEDKDTLHDMLTKLSPKKPPKRRMQNKRLWRNIKDEYARHYSSQLMLLTKANLVYLHGCCMDYDAERRGKQKQEGPSIDKLENVNDSDNKDEYRRVLLTWMGLPDLPWDDALLSGGCKEDDKETDKSSSGHESVNQKKIPAKKKPTTSRKQRKGEAQAGAGSRARDIAEGARNTSKHKAPPHPAANSGYWLRREIPDREQEPEEKEKERETKGSGPSASTREQPAKRDSGPGSRLRKQIRELNADNDKELLLEDSRNQKCLHTPSSSSRSSSRSSSIPRSSASSLPSGIEETKTKAAKRKMGDEGEPQARNGRATRRRKSDSDASCIRKEEAPKDRLQKKKNSNTSSDEPRATSSRPRSLPNVNLESVTMRGRRLSTSESINQKNSELSHDETEQDEEQEEYSTAQGYKQRLATSLSIGQSKTSNLPVIQRRTAKVNPRASGKSMEDSIVIHDSEDEDEPPKEGVQQQTAKVKVEKRDSRDEEEICPDSAPVEELHEKEDFETEEEEEEYGSQVEDFGSPIDSLPSSPLLRPEQENKPKWYVHHYHENYQTA
ncbi:hypothetical protein QOT17_004413 [Balamuthia mandrillaris]